MNEIAIIFSVIRILFGMVRGVGTVGFFFAVGFGVVTFCWAKSSEEGLERYQTLIKRQPFLPKSETTSSSEKAVKPGSYRFTGFVIMEDSVRVGIENVLQNKSYLLKPGEMEDGIILKDINMREKYATVVAEGEEIRLDLVDKVTVTSPAASPYSYPYPGPPGGSGYPPLRRRIIVPRQR